MTITQQLAEALRVPLSKGKYALIDKKDYRKISGYKWYISTFGYAVAKVKSNTIFMHRIINDTPLGMNTDHINGNKVDNRKNNLRNATDSQNSFNSYKKGKKNKYKGVYKTKSGRWAAKIEINYKQKHLGTFDNPECAAKSYNSAAKELHGRYAKLNVLPEPPKVKQMKEYEMTQEQLDNLIDAIKSPPLIMLQCGMPPSRQELANNAWCALGKEMGFDGMTVQPTSKGMRFFTATPVNQ